MSLILEALSRSAKDRQADSNNPGLDTPAYVDEPEPGRAWLLGLLWGILFCALVAVGLLVADRYAPETAPPAADLVEVPKRQTVPGQSQTEDNKSSQALVGDVKPTRAVEPRASTPVPSAAVPTEIKAVDPVIPDPAVEALYASKSRPAPESSTPEQATGPAPTENDIETPPQRSEQVIDIEEVLMKTQEALKTARLQEHSAPFIADVSQQFKNDIPTIMYLKHDYSSKPGESFVILNGKMLREGGKTAAGMVVEEILSDSVVLNYRGKQFRLRALNSWVNL